jgi:6-phosphogluconolactonase/glucosamine-6-phosphate isomerase/deaminase
MTAAGKAAISVHSKLSQMINAGNLKNIRIFLADERCVSQYHCESNYRAIKKIYSFTKSVHVNKFYNCQFGPDKSIKKYQKFFSRGIDVLILGLANDGHIASLFSGRGQMTNSDELILLKRDCEFFERLTINYSFIDKKCRKVYLLVNNILKKRIVMQTALKSDGKSPLYCLYHQDAK